MEEKRNEIDFMDSVDFNFKPFNQFEWNQYYLNSAFNVNKPGKKPAVGFEFKTLDGSIMTDFFVKDDTGAFYNKNLLEKIASCLATPAEKTVSEVFAKSKGNKSRLIWIKCEMKKGYIHIEDVRKTVTDEEIKAAKKDAEAAEKEREMNKKLEEATKATTDFDNIQL